MIIFENPTEFLSQRENPGIDDFRPYFSFPALPFLIVCLYAHPQWIPDFEAHLTDDPLLPTSEDVAAALVWLAAVAQGLKDGGKTLDSYLTQKHGEAILPKYSTKGVITGKELNLIHHAEKFSITHHVGYDSEKKCFYSYRHSKGLWEETEKASLRSLAGDYWKKVADSFSRSDPSYRAKLLALRKPAFLNNFVETVSDYSHFYAYPTTGILHAKNCMVHIGVGEIQRRPFSPLYFSRSQLAVNFSASAKYPKFQNYLDDVIEVDDQTLLQLWAGQLLTGINVAQKMVLLTGKGGGGKSSFMLMLQNLVGPKNCAEFLTEKGKLNSAQFGGKNLLLGLDVDPDFLEGPHTSVLKKLTGGDSVGDFEGVFNVGITANDVLTIKIQRDMTAWKRRLVHIPFKPRPENSRIEREFGKKLVEREGPGILNWAIKGVRVGRHRVHNLGDWPQTQTQEDRVNAILLASESLFHFLKAAVDKSPTEHLFTEDISTAYAAYCGTKNWPAMSKRKVENALTRLMPQIFDSRLRTDLPFTQGKKTTQKRGYARVCFKNLQ